MMKCFRLHFTTIDLWNCNKLRQFSHFCYRCNDMSLTYVTFMLNLHVMIVCYAYHIEGLHLTGHKLQVCKYYHSCIGTSCFSLWKGHNWFPFKSKSFRYRHRTLSRTLTMPNMVDIGLVGFARRIDEICDQFCCLSLGATSHPPLFGRFSRSIG